MKKLHKEKIRLYAPGPTFVEPKFVNTEREILHHRSDEFSEQFIRLTGLFNKLIKNKTGGTVFMSGSGTSGMDMIVNSYADRDGKNIIFSGGTFGRRWKKIFDGYGIGIEFFDYGMTEELTPDLVKRSIEGKDIKKAFLTHTETSSGWKIKVKDIVPVLKEKGIKVIVDCVASIGADKFHIEEWGVDMMVTASQKGLNLPPGIGIISYSKDAKQEVLAGPQRGFYLDLKSYIQWADKNSVPYTPAVSLMYLLEKRFNSIFDYGYDAWFAKRQVIRNLLREALKKMGLKCNADPSPANGVTVAFLPEGITSQYFRQRLMEKYAIFFAGGRDELQENTFRIGHFNPFDVEDLLFAVSSTGSILEEMKPDIKTDDALNYIRTEINRIRK